MNFLNRAKERVKGAAVKVAAAYVGKTEAEFREDMEKARQKKEAEARKKRKQDEAQKAADNKYISELKATQRKKDIRAKYSEALKWNRRKSILARTRFAVNERQKQIFLAQQRSAVNANILNEKPWLHGDIAARQLEKELNGFGGVSSEGDVAAFRMEKEVSGLSMANIGLSEIADIEKEVFLASNLQHKKPSKSVSEEVWAFSNLLK